MKKTGEILFLFSASSYFCKPKYRLPDKRSIIKKTNKTMKKGIHPENYRPVVFKDMSNDDMFITRSTINAKDTIEIDGVTYVHSAKNLEIGSFVQVDVVDSLDYDLVGEII